jgi:glutamate-1-semialdehyde aminotransferase
MQPVSARERALPRIRRSEALLSRSRGLIPADTQTLAKGPGQFVRGVAPVYLERGRGCRVWDVDGNEFIDLSMAVGPVSLGYCYERVDAAIREQLAKGITFSLMSPLEVEVAELVQKVVPGVESVRFSKTGCDVTSAAVRLARAFTGRNEVLCCGYHGWHDWYISVTDRNRGIPAAVADQTYTFRYNDLAHLEASLGDDVACVIMEPVVFDLPEPGYLAGVRDLCRRHGALLVFDEMWTGFRLALGGAQERFGIEADLVTFSKAVANGMPLSILAGRRDVMRLLEEDVFFFTTFGGEALSLAAARATIQEIRDCRVPTHLATQGAHLKDGFNDLAWSFGMSYVRCAGPECRTVVMFDSAAGDPLELKSLLQQELIRRGILWSGFHNLSFSHGPGEIERILAAYAEALPILRRAVDRKSVRAELQGDPVQPVFRRTGSFNIRPRS